jgi:hypothetical protein
MSQLFSSLILPAFGGVVETAASPSVVGTTSARPVGQPVGFMYFDTTLGIPIWYTDTGWVNATGALT